MQTANQESAARALFEAQRTGCASAILAAMRRQATAATQREAERQHAIGAAGRRDESIAGYFGATL